MRPLTLCLVSICCFLLVVFDDVGGVGGYPTRPYINPNSKSLLMILVLIWHIML